jgi:hypothetical protein
MLNTQIFVEDRTPDPDTVLPCLSRCCGQTVGLNDYVTTTRGTRRNRKTEPTPPDDPLYGLCPVESHYKAQMPSKGVIPRRYGSSLEVLYPYDGPIANRGAQCATDELSSVPW